MPFLYNITRRQIYCSAKLLLGVARMTDIDLLRLLNEPIYAFDFQFNIGDIQDHLDFSENNIELQYRSELESIRLNAETGEFDSYPQEYRCYLENIAEQQFKTSLPLQIRYGAHLALTTAVEWSVLYLAESLTRPVGKKPNNKNETVYRLEIISKRVTLKRDDSIKDLEAIVRIRNCIAHNAGIPRDNKYRENLNKSIQRLEGFSLANWHCFGKRIAIEKDALNRYIEEMKHLVIDLHKAADEKGLLKNNT
jgi:hypothetical protein